MGGGEIKMNIAKLVVYLAIVIGSLVLYTTKVGADSIRPMLAITQSDTVKFAKSRKIYELTINLENVGNQAAWDTYLKYTFPENAEIVSINPEPRTLRSDSAEWYLYNFQPGQNEQFTVTLKPQHKGIIENRTEAWYRSDTEPATWYHPIDTFEVIVKGKK